MNDLLCNKLCPKTLSFLMHFLSTKNKNLVIFAIVGTAFKLICKKMTNSFVK